VSCCGRGKRSRSRRRECERPPAKVSAGALTGISNIGFTAPKRLELPREFLPGVKRLGLLGDATDAGTKVEQEALASPAAAMGITIIHAEAASPGDCDGAIAALIVRRVDAICLLESALNFNMRSGVIELAYQKRVPVINAGAPDRSSKHSVLSNTA